MDLLNEAWSWSKANPWGFRLVVGWLVLTAVSHIKLSEATARAYPRLFAFIMLARDWGGYLARGLRPLVGLVAPSAVRHLIDAVYGTSETAALAAPPGEMKSPIRDPAPSLPEVRR